MVDKMDIRDLTIEELTGVINACPWFGGARKELCRRMSILGNGAWGEDDYSGASLYICSREKVYGLMQSSRRENYSDSEVHDLLRRLFRDKRETSPAAAPAKAGGTRYIIVGGDYFSQDQYAGARREGDGIFSSFATKARDEGVSLPETGDGDMSDFYTETLAQVYLEQGYFAQAKKIYSALSLRYPEKSVYFAAQIDKIDKSI